jgi:8-oxo-dGTP pyrophosphatase MutT (NUDIX family)
VLDIDPLRDGPTPAAAATVVLVREGEIGPEVLLVQRNRATAFMGGAFVFPGGRVDPGDSSRALLAIVDGLDEASARLTEPDLGDGAAALFVAAIRETLEEAGILLGELEGDLAALRAAMAGGRAFGEAAVEAGARLDARRLTPFARWVTPAVERKRFDTRFFVALVDRAEVATHDAHETVASLWISPTAAVEKHLAGAIDLPPPTLRTLELFSPHASARAIVESARREPPPLVRPVFRDLAGSWILALPGDPEHPEKGPVLAGTTRFVCRDARWYSK